MTTNEVRQIGNVSPKRNGGGKWLNPSVNRVYDCRYISPTINTMQGGNRQPMIIEKMKKWRVRKLIPAECSKLMGLEKSDDEKMKNVSVSDTARYKAYGNGIITNCIELIFEHLYKAQYDNDYVCTDENFTQPLSSQKNVMGGANPSISFCIDANYFRGTTIETYLTKHKRQLIFEPDY